MDKYKCEFCEKEFENSKIKANHIRWKHKYVNGNGYTQLGYATLKEKSVQSEAKKHGGLFEEFKVHCNKCGNIFLVKERKERFLVNGKKYFCSKKCANSRNIIHSEETKKLLSEKSKQFWKNPEYVRKQLSVNRYFTSKGEREIRDFFIKKFPNEEWKFGLLKECDLLVDLYSEKLKTVIEYDGIWHFKNIKGQLPNKQKLDLKLEKWCENNNWKLIRIKEEVYYSNKKKWIESLINAVYIKNMRLVKFY